MCATCGCSGKARLRLVTSGHDHSPGGEHHHDGGHHHGSEHHDGDDRTVMLQQKVLARNDELAGRNREWLRERGVLAVNLMSSPGAGKTALLERTARDLAGRLALSVIEGDQETALDAGRISSAGCQVVQVNTGVGCHLDAVMVADALHALDPQAGTVVVIENVGNLVCPALFDLGEAARIVLASVTEGADKPAKYPHMFSRADVVLVTKTDLLPYVDFDVAAFLRDARTVNPRVQVLQVSATRGDGVDAWYRWLSDSRRQPVPG